MDRSDVLKKSVCLTVCPFDRLCGRPSVHLPVCKSVRSTACVVTISLFLLAQSTPFLSSPTMSIDRSDKCIPVLFINFFTRFCWVSL